MTTHLSGPIAVIREGDMLTLEAVRRMDKAASVRFLQDAGILDEAGKLAAPYRNTQDGWDWPNPNPGEEL